MNGPTVFISYSHQDEAWKDELVRQLRVLEVEGVLSIWSDQKIAAGDDWCAEIEKAMTSAKAAVLLISADFLISDFIRGTEVPCFLQRRAKDGLRVIPLIVRPCAWQAVDWLKEMQCRPKNGRALSKGRKAKVEEDLATLALEIQNLLRQETPKLSPAGGPHLDLGRLPSRVFGTAICCWAGRSRRPGPVWTGSPGRAPARTRRRMRSGSGKPAGRCWSGRGRRWSGLQTSSTTWVSSTSPSTTSPWAAPTSAWL